MATFKDHKVTVNQLLDVIPEGLLSHLAENTKVDYCTKVLHGRKMFYLLLYGILENDRLSQRTLEDTFHDSIFKPLFQLDDRESIRRSSISERLSRINADYFRQIYECIYDQFRECYSDTQRQNYNLIRVDSSMVSEASARLLSDIDNKSGKKAVKYSIAFDGLLPCNSILFTDSKYGSEDIALPEVIRSHVKQEPGHQNIYIIDRGLQSTRNMREFSNENIRFIARTKENRKHVELESLMTDDVDLGELILLKDSKVYLYTGVPVNNKQGNVHYRQELVQMPFRLIVGQSKTEPKQQYWFITNDFR